MNQLHYVGSSSGWNGYVTVNFEAVYDPVTNCTTVTFMDSNHKYYGRNGYGSKATTVLTVTAEDSGNSESSTFFTEGPTNGGEKIFTGKPAPTTVTVQHSSGTGVKFISIAGSTTFYAALYSSSTMQSYVYGNGSTTISMVTAYTLRIGAGDGATVIVNRTSSSVASLGSVHDKSMIYAGDELEVTYSTDPGYTVDSATINGTAIESGISYTVSSDVVIEIITSLASIIYIGDKIGTLYIYLGGEWYVGSLHYAKSGNWSVGTGYIFEVKSDSDDKITTEHDSHGNVIVYGLTSTHDGDGNVVLSGATVIHDANGNITIAGQE